jgi:hypothetical protein
MYTIICIYLYNFTFCDVFVHTFEVYQISRFVYGFNITSFAYVFYENVSMYVTEYYKRQWGVQRYHESKIKSVIKIQDFERHMTWSTFLY